MLPQNRAAWLPAAKAQLQVRDAPYTAPARNEILVHNGAVAINPVDWIKQDAGDSFAGHVKYPFIGGSDVAGEVFQAGPGVNCFKVGDRVLGHAVGMNKRSNKSSEGAFQLYTVLRTNMASRIPQSMSFESACVLPLAVSTAACALFGKDFLALTHPKKPSKSSESQPTLLVWGGSTSVGCNAIQLGRAAGCRVFATASNRNHEYLKKLGAEEVFEYNSPSAVNDISAAFKGRVTAGAISIGTGSFLKCVEIMSSCEGNKFVAAATFDPPASEILKGITNWPTFALTSGYEGLSSELAQMIRQVKAKFIYASDIMANEVSMAVYQNYLPQALAEGWYMPAPEPEVCKGLEHIQNAMDVNKKGVSAKKIVVSL